MVVQSRPSTAGVMRVLLVVLSCYGLAYAQSFPSGLSYDFNIPTLSADCRTALNKTVQCSWMLPAFDVESLELTKDNLTTICTPKCRSSLRSSRASMKAACPVSDNQIVLDDIAYPATETIDRLTDLYEKLCLKDS
jgi:hypothetical protein